MNNLLGKKDYFISDFKKHSFEKRKNESETILKKYPNRIPVIIDTCKTSFTLDKHKYLIPDDLTVTQLLFIIRKRCKLAPEMALFIFVNNSLPLASNMLLDEYKKNMDKDGFLYIVIREESTFG